MRDDHLSHPECKSKNVPQQSRMGFSYKGNGLIRAVGRAGVRAGVRVRVRVWIRVRIRVRAYTCKLDDLDDHLSWV